MAEQNSDPPGSVDRDRETLPPDFHDRQTLLGDPEPYSTADVCRDLVGHAKTLSQSQELPTELRIQFWFITCEAERILESHGSSPLLLKHEFGSLLQGHVPKIEKDMRELPRAIPDSEREAYVLFMQLATRLE